MAASPAMRLRRWLLPALTLAMVLLIALLDWVTPTGVVVGMLISIPIVLASFSDSRGVVWLTFYVGVAAFFFADFFGRGPISPPLVWVPNRIFALVTLPASCGVALMLQRRRLEAVRARDAAMASSELNRLLTALLAHDLRTPLLLASQGLAYVQDAVASGRHPDPEILAALGARLQRSLRAIDATLAMARRESELPHPPAAGPHPPVQVAREIEEEVASFAEEARARRKTLESGLDGLEGRHFRVDGRVLRQGLGVLIDNSIRHAAPGVIRVSAEVLPSWLGVRVEDDGTPAADARGEGGWAPAEGAGLGLDLCRALAVHAGGSLDVERCGPDGTSFVLRLPAVPVGDRE